ncbi:carbohydrate sulfotransferase 15-like [Haliotis rubra]|uniref:carbohydrate sulfotransferase 15-like n=1 Tax=Haliotis rubra TaxID=36100 RepID=UPI001EE5722C|nr:carbohydrate sulfotransferase 15-like [Haliotis rubra]
MRKWKVVVFTLVPVWLLTRLLLDKHILRLFTSVTNKPWTNTFKSQGVAIGQTDSENRRISLACHHNSSSPPLDDETQKRYEIHDLFRVKTPAFLSNYKNPCWKQGNPSKLVCLPYFYQIGFPKCGTTLTFSTIVGHPEAVMGEGKEPHWITRTRFAESSQFQSYLNYFTPAARVIESKASIDPVTGQMFHPIITGDGSVSTAWHNQHWRHLPGNYNCTEPRVLAPHYIYHLNPSTKIIILVRNPTERTISQYNYMLSNDLTAESFHATVLQVGLYHVFIREWMNVFPADQILIARVEDIHEDPYIAFTRIFDFLGLSRVSRSELKEMLNQSRMNDRSKKFQATNETRRLLDDFYRPHNIQLARLLQQHDPNSYSNIHDAMYNH